jgi:hypothetical protein
MSPHIKIKFLPILLLAIFFSSVRSVRSQDTPKAIGNLAAESSESEQVWVNKATGIYHYAGTRWYGNTNYGEYMSEAEARKDGYRPARNRQS